MFFQNLSLFEFIGLFSAISGMVVALYLLDRSRRKQTVSTLRFWRAAQQLPEKRHRKRIQQPWSLILQLISLALLLLALGQLRWGSAENATRDHVLLLDTSAWMGARGKRGALMDEARALAIAYVRSVPPGDRVMLVRTDAFPTPATGFETNRAALESAIRNAQPSAAGLDLPQTMAFAQRMRNISGHAVGEIVYAGPGRALIPDGYRLPEIKNLRVLAVNDAPENSGLKKIGLRRSPSEPDVWEIFVTVHNYGRTARTVPLALQFGNAPVGSKVLTIPPNSDQSATFNLRTKAAGWLEARLMTPDGFPLDDRALLEVPPQKRLKVAVYSDESELLQPVLSANSRVAATFQRTADYKGKPDADVIIIDRFRPVQPPQMPAIWIEPPAEGSPVRIASRVENVPLVRWRSDHTLGTGLHTEDLRLESAQVFASAPDDLVIAEVAKGPVMLARGGARKLVVMGFHPMRSAMKYELATPLLFANILHWMSPEIFRRWELSAGSAGPVTVTLDSETRVENVKVLDENQRPLPFSLNGRTVRFFSGTAGTVRVLTPNDEIIQSLTLPEVPETTWQPPKDVRRGVPNDWPIPSPTRDLWQLLALLGGAGLLTEWLLFGRVRRSVQTAPILMTIKRKLTRKHEGKAV